MVLVDTIFIIQARRYWSYYGGSRHVQDNDISNIIYTLLQFHLQITIQIQNTML